MNATSKRALRRPAASSCARLAAAAIVAASMAFGSAPESAAFAETGSVTVNAVEGNAANTYKVFQVFTADIDESDMASHIAWNAGAKSQVLPFLDENGYPAWLAAKGYAAAGAHDNAQNAAEFVAEKIGGSANDANAGTTPATKAQGSFANSLARALATAKAASYTATVGVPFTNVEGYYLIVTDPASLSDGEAATAPIWLALGGSVKTITEKSAIPTLDKKVKGAGDADWSNATDAFHAQDVDFKLTGTLPSNIGAYSTYHYRFVDRLSGLDMKSSNTSSVKVSVDGTDVTSKIAGQAGSIAYADSTLTVDIADLLSLQGVRVDKNSKVVVEYKAHATAKPDGKAADGGTNSAEVIYTNDPVGDGEGKTPEKTVYTYSYKADIVKIDKGNKQPLPHAKFTVQVKEYPGDPTLVGGYVQADGAIAKQPYEFESDAQGNFSVSGLDAGTYTIAETAAPKGYELQDADITLQISPSIDGQSGELGDLVATVSGGEAASVAGDEATKVVSIDAKTGSIKIQAADDKTFKLANTGLEGIGAYLALAAGLTATGSAGLLAVRIRSRREGRE